MKTIVIYHKSDFDGLFCREIAKKFIPDATMIGWEYGEPVPLVFPEDKLYVLDLSIEELMLHPQLTWIDHHKTAIDKFPSKIIGYRIDGVAACRLAWQWFTQDHTDPVVQYHGLPDKQDYINRKVQEPWAVRLAGEYDIWDKRDPSAELFQHGLRSEDLDWTLLFRTDKYSEEYVQKLLNQGKALQYSRAKEAAGTMKAFGHPVLFEGLRFVAVNSPKVNSQFFESMIGSKDDGCLAYHWTGFHWRISMYGVPHKPDVDLSAIAIKHGGGGHKQACGFTCKTLPFTI